MALPESGSLSIKGGAGAGRSISQEVDGNETGDKSLTALAATAGLSLPVSMTDFYGYSSLTPPNAPTGAAAMQSGLNIEVTWFDGGGSATDNYTVTRSINGSGYSFVASPTDPSYTDSGPFSISDLVIYRVTAANAAGSSSYDESNPVIYGV